MANNETFPPHWLRAVLPLAVLQVLKRGETYGYEISTLLLEAGFGDIKGGTLYPLLGRLERDGLVRTQWRSGASGPGRKYYTLTEAGHTALADQKEQWARFTATTAEHFTPTKGTGNE